MQTYSFFGEQSEAGKRVLAALVDKFDNIGGAEDVSRRSAPPTPYDARCTSSRRPSTRRGARTATRSATALESLGSHEGLIKTYDAPFSADNHDALNENDYIMVRFVGNQISPIE